MKECALSTCLRATTDKYCCYDHQRGGSQRPTLTPPCHQQHGQSPMTLLPGNGVCKTCGDSIEDSCGGETRNCAFCRKLKMPTDSSN